MVDLVFFCFLDFKEQLYWNKRFLGPHPNILQKPPKRPCQKGRTIKCTKKLLRNGSATVGEGLETKRQAGSLISSQVGSLLPLFWGDLG